MRWNLMKCFDKIYIIDLHGNSKKKEICPDGSKDENVFDIQQGVSINICIKTSRKTKNKLAEVYHFDIFGKREEKYDYLLTSKFSKVPFTKLLPFAPEYFFVPKDYSVKNEFDEGFSVQELFHQNGVGICSKRDDTAFQNTKRELINVLNDFKNLSEQEIKQKYETEKKESRDKKTAYAKQNIISFGIEDDFLQQILYRPFETKWTYFTKKSKGFLAYPVYDVMHNFLNNENYGLIIGRQGQVVGPMPWNLIFISNNIADLNIFYRGGGVVFPLYRYETDLLNTTRAPNLNLEIIENIAKIIKLEFEPEKSDNTKKFAPIDVLNYIYAVLHSPAYRGKYREFLKIDFPRIPYPENAKQFHKLSKLGEKLCHLHLLRDIEPKQGIADYPIPGNNKIEKITYSDNKVYINQTQYFAKVPAEAWSFYIGGYQPAQKWLKDRKGRELSYEDIQHYRRVVLVLRETWRVMGEIDKIQEGT
jgi:predicted helicase